MFDFRGVSKKIAEFYSYSRTCRPIDETFKSILNYDLSILVQSQSEHNYLNITFDIVLLLYRIFRTLRMPDFYYTKQQNHSYFYK